ncbi:MAG: ABC transporter permease [Xanthomonadales bacterium]|nr:ABC transporter permease [Xanthomonadales bacterium]
MMWQRWWERVRQDPVTLAALVLIMLFFGVACGSWLGLIGGGWSDTSSLLRGGFSAEHWFGTNAIGQDIFQRAVFGTGVAFQVGVSVALGATLLGAVFGSLAGYFHQRAGDGLIGWLMGVIESIPFYLLVAALAFAMQGHNLAMYLAMTLAFWTTTARLVRAETIRLRQMPFVEAARTLGVGQSAILSRHILPNTSHLLLIQFTITFVGAVKAEVVLSFLGLGIQDGVSWGLMIAESTSDLLAGHFSNFLVASISLFLLVMALNLLADAMQDALDPRFSHPADPGPAEPSPAEPSHGT